MTKSNSVKYKRSRFLEGGVVAAVTLTLLFPAAWVSAQALLDSTSLDGAIADTTDSSSSSGSFGGILRLLGISKWVPELNDLLNDPCRDAPVIFITSPEPGWCTGNGGTGSDIASILNGSSGEMGIPNPNEARPKVEQQAMDGSVPDLFDINSIVYGQQTANLADRIATKQSVESVLGQQGQAKMSQNIESGKEIVAANEQAASTAQEMDVTQDIMKLIIQNDARSSTIALATQNELQDIKVSSQFTNLNLANVSRTLDENAKHARVERAANSNAVLSLAAQTGLIGQK